MFQDIAALLEHLRATHVEGDLYRGQTRDYPSLIPSAYRRGIVAGSENDAVVRLDPQRVVDELPRRESLRWSVMNELIGEYGIAIGNLLAQQYGISSECVDVSEDPAVAAFFATRRWPAYEHAGEPGTGVIYRFRNAGISDLPPVLSFEKLSTWLQMGVSDGVYFESFVRDGEWIGTFDRDHWFNWQAGVEAIVATLPLSLRWTQILAMAESDERKEAAVPAKEWRLSRVGSQSGGFLRPMFHWEAHIPQRYDLAHNMREMQELYMRGSAPGPWLGWWEQDEGDRIPWPRAVPSLAIKRRMIGVENLRHRSGCEAFFFQHGARRITGFYRRLLWPEPSEDPLYARMWDRAGRRLFKANGYDFTAAVDDPDEGLIDRGYRVAGELQTMSARELPDLMRGQLEDAQEALAHGEPTAIDCTRASAAWAWLGDERKALAAAIRAMRLDSTSLDAALTLAISLKRSGKLRCAERALRHAATIDPAHPSVLHGLAGLDMQAGDYVSACTKLKQALATLDFEKHRIPEYILLDDLVVVAGVIDDRATLMKGIERLAEIDMPLSFERLSEEIERRRAR